MKYFHKIAEKQTIMPLLTAIARQPELWNKYNIRTNFNTSPHKYSDDILLRYNDLIVDETIAKVLDNCEAIDFPAFALLPQARPLIFDLMRFVEGKRLGRCIIAKLKAGDKITPHIDEGINSEYYSRYHIVLNNVEGCDFRAEDEIVNMKTGDIYWFDNSGAEHELINNSHEDFITLIIDIKS